MADEEPKVGESKVGNRKVDEPIVDESRARAEKAREKRALARAERAAAEKPKPSKAQRKWWNWLIDAALIGAAAYLIKARFFTKEPAAPEPSPRASSSVLASSSAAPTMMLKASTEVHGGAGPLFAVIETIAMPTTFEALEAPTAGWVKVKLPSGKIGWVPIDAIASGVKPP